MTAYSKYQFLLLFIFVGGVIRAYTQDLVPVFLGSGINSEWRELNPIISPDGNYLYFSRVLTEGEAEKEITFRSQKKADGTWARSERLPQQFNSIQNNALLSISADGNMALIRGAFENGNYTGRGFSVIYREANGWSKAEALDIKSYNKLDNGVYSGGFLSADGQTLLMYFGELPGQENCDLYFSHLKEDGTWTKPKNLGKAINSRKTDEISPFLAADNRTLYFSSNRKGGMGRHDIYLSKRLDDSWTSWSEPVNLGAPINTPNWEAYYSISASGDFAYMTATKEKGAMEDIVRIPLKSEFKPNPVVLLYGKAIDSKTQLPVRAKILYEQLPEGKNSGYTYSNPTDGSYKIVLPFGFNYGINAQAQGYYAVNENIDLQTESNYQEIQKNIRLFPIETGQTFRLNNIFFDLNKTELKAESFPELNRVVRLLLENPKLEIEISGHTDDLGSSEYNLKLSQGRANAVKTYLVSKGIEPSRIRAVGFGETKPLATNKTESGRAENRRVEFTILKN